MELVSRGGSTFFVPVADREMQGNGITNFQKWEQAFRVFSNIYLKAYPSRAIELVQYNHLIHTAAQTFVWENVYRYNKEFRLHIGNFPQRSWSIILQQAWSVYLKDRISDGNGYASKLHSPGPGYNNGNNNNHKKIKEECKRFNKGKCNKGYCCQYEHRCLIRGKFGHGAHICRHRKDKDDGIDQNKKHIAGSAMALK